MASRLQDVILRGVAAARPLAPTVAPGTLYYATDTKVTTRCANDNLTWESYDDVGSVALPTLFSSINLVIDGGASVISTGLKGYLNVPFACTIKEVTLLADVSGSVVVDIWKDVYASYPPTVADSITASAKPTITAALKSQDSTLTGWTTTIAAGDVLGYNVNSVASIQKLTVSLKVQI